MSGWIGRTTAPSIGRLIGLAVILTGCTDGGSDTPRATVGGPEERSVPGVMETFPADAGGEADTGSDAGSDAGSDPGSDAGSDAGPPPRESWDTADPPTRDTALADTYCATAYEELASTAANRMDDAALGDLNTLYHMARLYHGAEGIWQVTGDERVVDISLDLALATIDAGQDLDGDGDLDYCFREPDGSVGSRGCDHDASNLLPTYPWRAMRGPARTLRMAMESSAVSRRPADVERLRAFIWNDVIDKWLDLDGDGPDEGQRGTSTVGIQARMSGILLDYHAATGDLTAFELGRQRVLAFVDNLQTSPSDPDAYWWDNWMPPREGDVADTSHSNEIVVALLEGFEAGILPYETIHPLHATWQRIIWNGDSGSPRFSYNVDGSGSLSPRNVVLGFMRLGQFQGASQSLATQVEFSRTYDLEAAQGFGHLCRIHGMALTAY